MNDYCCEAPGHGQRRALYCVRIIGCDGLPYAKNICRPCARRVRYETPHVELIPLFTVRGGPYAAR